MKTAIGIGTAGLLGAYYLYGTKAGAGNRKKIEAWMLRAKADVIEQTSALKHVSEEQYKAIVDTVMEKYRSMKGVDVAEIVALGAILKKHWNSMTADLAEQMGTKKTKTTTKKSTGTGGGARKKKPTSSSGGAEA